MSDYPPPSDPNWGQDPQSGQVPDHWSPSPAGPTEQSWGPGGDPYQQGYPDQGHQQHPHGQPGDQWSQQQGYEQPPSNWGGQPYQNPAYGGYGYAAYSRPSQATTALVLSIVGFFCCFFLSVAGLFMGRAEMKAIDQGLTDPSHRGVAQAAFIVGAIVVGLNVLVLGFYVIAIIAAGVSGA